MKERESKRAKDEREGTIGVPKHDQIEKDEKKVLRSIELQEKKIMDEPQ